MKIQILFFVVITIFFSENIKAQCGIPENLIHNCGFETWHANRPNVTPWLAQVHHASPNPQAFIEEWRTRTHVVKTKNSVSICSDEFSHLHSPDLFREGTIMRPPLGNSSSGDMCIGMGDYELIQQKFHNNKRLIDGENYILSFNFRLSDRSVFNVLNSGNWTESDLKFYLAKNKIKYKEEKISNTRDCLEICEKKYVEHSTSTLNFLSLTSLNWNNYPLADGWHRMELPFVAVNMQQYDWFAMELVLKNYSEPSNPLDGSCIRNYILLDEISIAPSCAVGCEIACSQTDGPIRPNANSLVDGTQLFRITNLDNATDALLKIYPLTGQTPIYSELYNCPNGIGDITWNGTNYNGSPVASGNYRWTLTQVKNDCGNICEFSDYVQFQGHAPQAEIFNCPVANLTPTPCCPQNPDIFIDNLTIPGPDPLEWQAINNINIATQNNSTVTVNNDANVTFRAGSSVVFGPGYETQPGAVVETIIEVCQ